MGLRVLNRRDWITAAGAILASGIVGRAKAVAQSPPMAARVASLPPSPSDEQNPVVTALAVDPSGSFLAVAGDDHSIRILRAADFGEITTLKGHRDLIRTVRFRGDGKVLASAGNDGILILWDATHGYKEVRRAENLTAICCVRFAPQAKQIVAVGFNSEILLFGGPAERLTLECDCNDLRVCNYDAQGQRLVIAGRSGHAHLYDPRTGDYLDALDLHTGRIRDCDFTSDGQRLVSVGEDGAAVMVDLQSAKVLRRIDLLPCKLFTLAKISDQRWAVAGSDNRIRIVDFDSGMVVTHLDGHRGSINSLAYANGALFSGGFDATLRRWPLAIDGGERLAEKETAELPPK